MAELKSRPSDGSNGCSLSDHPIVGWRDLPLRLHDEDVSLDEKLSSWEKEARRLKRRRAS